MCSIEEAWAGQTFQDKHVSSQGDIHNSYMSLPDNLLTRDNEFTITNSNTNTNSILKSNVPQSRNLTRGINSKYSREPRVPQSLKSTNNLDINVSSQLKPMNTYGGIEPLPSYMQIYNNSNSNSNSNSGNSGSSGSSGSSSRNTYQPTDNYSMPMPMPMPVMAGEKFTDINNAYDVSSTLNNFMNAHPDTSMNNTLIIDDQYTEEESKIINNKFNNMIKKRNNDNDNDHDKFVNINDMDNNNFELKQIYQMLGEILNKINKIEGTIHNNSQRNVYDIVLYVIIGMLLSFIMYSIFQGLKK
jgi:hypothetical protein